jgi:hypothetical protein
MFFFYWHLIGGDQKLLFRRLDGDEVAVVVVEQPLGRAAVDVVKLFVACH